MKELVTIFSVVDQIFDKGRKAVVEKATITANASVECAKINANKDIMRTGLVVTGAMCAIGMVTKTISQIKGKEGKTNE